MTLDSQLALPQEMLAVSPEGSDHRHGPPTHEPSLVESDLITKDQLQVCNNELVGNDEGNSKNCDANDFEDKVCAVDPLEDGALEEEDSLRKQREGAVMPYYYLLKRNPAYRWLFLAFVVSVLGDWINYLASLQILKSYTDSGLALSGLLICRTLPQFFFAPIAGVFADRFDRRWLMITADSVRGMLVLSYLLVRSKDTLWILYVGMATQFCFTSMFNPARSALMPMFVHRDDLVTANTLDMTTWSTLAFICMCGGAAAELAIAYPPTIAASVLGGFLTAIFGATGCYLIDSATFVVSALCVAQLFRYGQNAAEDGIGAVDAVDEESDCRLLSESDEELIEEAGEPDEKLMTEGTVMVEVVSHGGKGVSLDAQNMNTGTMINKGDNSPLPKDLYRREAEAQKGKEHEHQQEQKQKQEQKQEQEEVEEQKEDGEEEEEEEKQLKSLNWFPQQSNTLEHRNNALKAKEEDENIATNEEHEVNGVLTAGSSCGGKLERHEFSDADNQLEDVSTQLRESKVEEDATEATNASTSHPKPRNDRLLQKNDTSKDLTEEHTIAAMDRSGQTTTTGARLEDVSEIHVTHKQGGLRMLYYGYKYIFTHPYILCLCCLKASKAIAVAGINEANIVYSQNDFAIGEEGSITLGILYAVIGVGTAIAPLIGKKISGGNIRRMHSVTVASFGLGFSTALLVSWSPNLIVFLGANFMRSGASVLLEVFSTVLLQFAVPDHVRGRCFSFEQGLKTFSQFAGIAFAGVALDILEWSPHILVLSLACVWGISFAWWSLYFCVILRFQPNSLFCVDEQNL